MKPWFSESEYDAAKSSDLLVLSCYQCNSMFGVAKRFITAARKGSTQNACKYCSQACKHLSQDTKTTLSCALCGASFRRAKSQKRSPNAFCSKSCSVIYNNTHKTHGTRRSKLEIYLEEQIKKLFPTLQFHFNQKDVINSELDIYIPSLKLAFELNGIYHYEPIHGPEKLASVQNNDHRKFQACLERGIELCIIDTSLLKHFKEVRAKTYLDIVRSVIEKKLAISQS